MMAAFGGLLKKPPAGRLTIGFRRKLACFTPKHEFFSILLAANSIGTRAVT
jgi:hypothetical protein